MIDAGPEERQSEGDGDGFLEVDHLRRDVPLVVVQGKDGVIGPLPGKVEHRVGGNGAHDVHALPLCPLNRRKDSFDLLRSQKPPFTGVGIEGGHRQGRLFPVRDERAE